MAVDADSSITWFTPIHYVQMAAPQLHAIWRRKLERDAWDAFKCLLFLASAFSLQRSPLRDLLFSCIHADLSLFRSKWIKTKWACQSPARKKPLMSWLLHQSTWCGFWHLISELQKDSLLMYFLCSTSKTSYFLYLKEFILPWVFDKATYLLSGSSSKTKTTKQCPQMWSRAFVMKAKKNLIHSHDLSCAQQ